MLRKLILILCGIPLLLQADHPVRHVNQVVIWSYKLHSHTHSYIHWGFHRAFQHLGYITHWLDDNDNVSHINFKNSLFITMGATDNHKMPIRDDCYYVIHNGHAAKYKHLIDQNRCIFLQVYTHDCLERGDTEVSPCFHYSLKDTTIYMPWATDLLPYEIDAIKKQLPSVKKNKHACFVGSVYPGGHGNQPQIDRFRQASQRDQTPFINKTAGSCSMEQNIKTIQESLLAPALQGSWQCQKGYIPCRIFKNISYGAMGVTNSKTVYELFDRKIIYNEDPYQLYFDAKKRGETWTIQEQYELMDLVKEKHTYLNRIESLLQFFEMVNEYQQGHA